MSNQTEDQRVDQITGTVTLTLGEFQSLMAEKEKLLAEIAEGDRINGEAVNVRTELERQIYVLVHQRDALLEWRDRVRTAVAHD